MKGNTRRDLFLKTEGAKRIYESCRALPIIDFHNHLSVKDLSENRRFEDLFELWLAPDPYKHRLMRISGVDEHFITGGASPREKFRKYCEIFPTLFANPVYDWSISELECVFGIDTPISLESADYIFDRASEMLRSPEYRAREILGRFGVEYSSPVATERDDLSVFDGSGASPSLRGDGLLAPTKELEASLESRSGIKIRDTGSYIKALSPLLDDFSRRGCRFADHSLDAGFFDNGESRERELLTALAGEYRRRGWTLLLHLDAKRKTSPRLERLVGGAGGFAAVGGTLCASALCELIADMEAGEGLPDTVLFPLNMSDQSALAVMGGSFAEDGVRSKLQLGPAWWWCDHEYGIRSTLSAIASSGVLSCFIGMTTDSRSILSFVRHDYFRRILSSFLDEESEKRGGIPFANLEKIAYRISYENAKLKTQKGQII